MKFNTLHILLMYQFDNISFNPLSTESSHWLLKLGSVKEENVIISTFWQTWLNFIKNSNNNYSLNYISIKRLNLNVIFKFAIFIIFHCLLFFWLPAIYNETCFMSSTMSLIPYNYRNKSIIPYNSNQKNLLYTNDPLLHCLTKYPKHKLPIQRILNNNLDSYSQLKSINLRPLLSLTDAVNPVKRLQFLSQLKNQGGIYSIQYKHAPNIYYLGRTINFNTRILQHFNNSANLLRTKKKLYVFIQSIGLEHFNVHILEILESNIDLQIASENTWIAKYQPTLNTMSVASTKAPKVNNFSAFLQDRQRPVTEFINKKKEYTTYLYEYIFDFKTNTGHIQSKGTYASLTLVNLVTGLRKNTITDYMNTDYPKNGYLFYSAPLKDLGQSFELTKNLIEIKPYSYNKLVPVWAYVLNKQKGSLGKLELINNRPFESVETFSEFIQLTWATIKQYINSLKPDSKQGIYYFDSPITESQITSIIDNPIYLKSRTTQIYLYDSLTMKLVNGLPFISVIDVAKFLNVSKSTIFRKLDSNLPIISSESSFLAFKNELNDEQISEITNNKLK